ncbi:MAG: TraR/DksA C4-type zinc finger protein [Candidatus Hermodarchaeota archaeon]
MSNYDDEDYVNCENCEEEILQEKAIYVGGKPYCKDCYRNAEEFELIEDAEDFEDEDEDDYDQDDFD